MSVTIARPSLRFETRRFGVLLVVAFALASCAERAAPAGGSPRRDGRSAPSRYLALGDSFTIGTGSPPSRAFPARLVERWRAKGCAVELRNVAVNGYTTEDLIEEELPELERYRPSFVTVAVGANDIVRGRSEVDYRAALRTIFARARAGGASVVALPQPDWSRSPLATSFGDADAIAASIRRFNAILAEEARSAGARVVDLFPQMEEEARRGMIAGDGLHPSAEAYDAWASSLDRALPCPSSVSGGASSP